MSIEFVEHEPPAAGAPPVHHPTAPARPSPARDGSPVHGRVLAAVWCAAAVLTGLAVVPALYQWRQTVVVVDFDHTTTRVNRVDVDAFGGGVHAGAGLTPGVVGGTPAGAGGADGGGYGSVWLVLAVALLVVAAWAVLRPRSRRPAVVAAVAGAVLSGTVAALWLDLRAGSGFQAASVRVDRVPAAGFWLAAAGALAATVVGTVAAVGPGRPDHAVRAVRARWAARHHRADPAGLDLH